MKHNGHSPTQSCFSSKENNAPLKLRGFGISWKLADPADQCPPGQIGIPHFMAPEVVACRPYGCEADLWSLGVLLCVLLSGRLPFAGPKSQLFDRIRVADFSVSRCWTQVRRDSVFLFYGFRLLFLRHVIKIDIFYGDSLISFTLDIFYGITCR